jgi:hypothetical protein
MTLDAILGIEDHRDLIDREAGALVGEQVLSPRDPRVKERVIQEPVPNLAAHGYITHARNLTARSRAKARERRGASGLGLSPWLNETGGSMDTGNRSHSRGAVRARTYLGGEII